MRYVLPIVMSVMIFAGCGTVVPGPRYKVNVDDYSFTSDGRGVVYRTDRLRYYPFLYGFREGHDLYLYDRGSRKHRRIAGADAFSVSPFAPLILYSPAWGKRFKDREEPDFYLLDYVSGKKRGFFMPAGFDRSYLSYGFSYVAWKKGGSLTAYVNFVYCPGEKPRSWKWQREAPSRWNTKMWKVTIDPSLAGNGVSEAVAWDAKRMPEIQWSDVRRQKFTSPDGKEKLAFSKYDGYYTFNTTLSIRSADGMRDEYVVREHRLINVVQMGKSILYYVAAAPIIGLKGLLR